MQAFFLHLCISLHYRILQNTCKDQSLRFRFHLAFLHLHLLNEGILFFKIACPLKLKVHYGPWLNIEISFQICLQEISFFNFWNMVVSATRLWTWLFNFPPQVIFAFVRCRNGSLSKNRQIDEWIVLWTRRATWHISPNTIRLVGFYLYFMMTQGVTCHDSFNHWNRGGFRGQRMLLDLRFYNRIIPCTSK